MTSPTPQDGEGLGGQVSDEMVERARAAAMSFDTTPCRSVRDGDCTHPHSLVDITDEEMRAALTAVAPDIAAATRRDVLRTAAAESAEATAVLADALYGDRDGAGDHTVVTIAEEAAPLIRTGRQVREMYAGAQQRREQPAAADDPGARLVAEVRRQCAEEHLSAIEYLLSAYPADVFPPDGQSRDAIAGTALRTVLTANLKHWRTEWSGPARVPADEGGRCETCNGRHSDCGPA